MTEKKNPSVRERLSAIETAVVFIRAEIKDIKDNHLKKLDTTQQWTIGLVTIVLLGILGLIIKLMI